MTYSHNTAYRIDFSSKVSLNSWCILNLTMPRTTKIPSMRLSILPRKAPYSASLKINAGRSKDPDPSNLNTSNLNPTIRRIPSCRSWRLGFGSTSRRGTYPCFRFPGASLASSATKYRVPYWTVSENVLLCSQTKLIVGTAERILLVELGCGEVTRTSPKPFLRVEL